MNNVRIPDRLEKAFAAVLFATALLFHGWGARVGWNNLNLPGCEFRQTQTAISAYFIQREHNFSLAYPTPVLGKPWSIPMEFPLYQWTVVGLSNATGLPLTQAGRTVSLACFYAALPAFYLLLGRLGLPWMRRLVVLSFLLCCPLYVFYSRAFLIETMAWMFGAWFLAGYVFAVERRSAGFWALAAAGGMGAGLVKVTTLMFFLMPALAWTCWWFWDDFTAEPASGRAGRLLRRAAWCAACAALPGAAAVWWVHYSDHIKAQSVAGAFLQSGSMAGYNFGVGVRWLGATWAPHWRILFQEIASWPVLAAGGLVALLAARRWWAFIGAMVFFFFAIQVLCPILYAWHEYYYVANAMMLVLALGLALAGLLESRAPRWLAWSVIAGLAAGQAWGYLSFYYPGQQLASRGGSPLAWALQAVTRPDDVVICAGDDWSSIMPYFAQRRALMIRRDLETTWQLVHPAFRALEGEPVTAMVLYGAQRENRTLRDIAWQYFRIDPQPMAHSENAAIYLHEQLRDDARILDDLRGTAGIQLDPRPPGETSVLAGHEVETAGVLPRWRERFALLQPQPQRFFATFPIQPVQMGGKSWIMSHPDSRYWFKVAAGAHRMTVECMVDPQAYADSVPWGDRSDGISILVTAPGVEGGRQTVFSRYLNPRDQPADRGPQRMELEFSLPAGAEVELHISPGPQGNGARDWSMLGAVRID